MPRAWIKFCGLAREEDVEMCARHNPSALGFLLRKPSSKSANIDLLTIDRAKKLVSRVPSTIASVLLVHSTDPEEIIELATEIKPNLLQLQGVISIDACLKIKYTVSAVGLIKKLSITENSSLRHVFRQQEILIECAAFDSFVLDSATSASGRGGTGQTHDWDISRQIVEQYPTQRFILAGGLTHENIATATRLVRPYGIDVMSGVSDSPGIKSEGKIVQLLSALRQSEDLPHDQETGR